MCGRFTLRQEYPEAGIGSTVTWNQSPGMDVVTVRRDGNKHAVSRVRWGFLTHGMKHAYPNAQMENANRPGSLWASSLRSRRCIVPADGWYEWPRIGHRVNDKKRPHFIRFRDDRLFGFAGIWTRYGAEDPRESLAVLTTEPNELMNALPHERMPVIVDRAEWARWLDPETPGNRLLTMARPWPKDDLEMWPVDPWMNTPKHNEPKCIEPVGKVVRL